MKILLELLPTVSLVVYGQLIIKWRVQLMAVSESYTSDRLGRLAAYLLDPYIISAYLAALASSLTWLFVIERHPLTLAFPLYIGLIVLMVVTSGIFIFGEQMTMSRIIAVVFIVVGVFIGSRS
jgi:multidrug transporter EmrE-like cation transporter